MKPYIDISTNDGGLKMELLPLYGEKDVSLKKYNIDELIDTIKNVANKIQFAIQNSLQQVDEVQLEFGVSFTVSSDKIIAVIVNGSAEASMKITLNWKKE